MFTTDCSVSDSWNQTKYPARSVLRTVPAQQSISAQSAHNHLPTQSSCPHPANAAETFFPTRSSGKHTISQPEQQHTDLLQQRRCRAGCCHRSACRRYLGRRAGRTALSRPCSCRTALYTVSAQASAELSPFPRVNLRVSSSTNSGLEHQQSGWAHIGGTHLSLTCVELDRSATNAAPTLSPGRPSH